MRVASLALIPCLFAALAACAPQPSDSGALEDPADIACAQVGNPGTAVQGAASLEDDAQALIAPSDQPFTVSLSGERSSFLRVELQQAQALLLFVDLAAVASDLYLEGESQGLPQGSANQSCPDDIPEHFHLDLEQAGVYHLELSPAAVDDLWLMLMEGEGHVHER